MSESSPEAAESHRPTEAQRKAQAAQLQKLFDYLDALLTTYVQQRVEEYHFMPGQSLKVGRGGKLQEIPQVKLAGPMVDTFVHRLISLNNFKRFEDVEESDIRMSLGGRLNYDITLASPRGKVARSFTGQLVETPGGFGFILKLDPLFTLGFGQVIDIAQYSDAQLEEWFDTFAQRLAEKENPNPKDVIFSPNKLNPYVTVTGGLKPIEDVYTQPGMAERVARAIIKVANNPLVNDLVEGHGGRLQGLDLDLAYKTRAGRRFRVNIADSFDNASDHAPLITMRILPPAPWTIDKLPLPQVVLDTALNTRMGLVLICGTTGSGKSTTMCVLIDYLLKRKSINFLTIENPIETMFPAAQYPKSIISQRELGKHTENLHRGLESAVRQTLTMAMVGEIRNARDAAMALELAQSGHLIFATIHSGSVGESVRRLVDMFPADQEKKIREQLAAQYKLGMAQILVKGIKGQTELVLEVMKTNQEMKQFMMNQQEDDRLYSMRELIEMYTETGCLSLDQSLVQLFKDQKISEDTVMYNSPDPDALVYRQGKLGIKLSERWDATGAMIAEDMEEEMKMAMTYVK